MSASVLEMTHGTCTKLLVTGCAIVSVKESVDVCVFLSDGSTQTWRRIDLRPFESNYYR